MESKYNTLRMLFIVMLFSIDTQGQGEPFNCDFNAYLFQYNDVYALNLASGSSFEIATDITTGNVNAVAYNPKDGYIWGALSTPLKSIVRIGKDFSTTTYNISSLPNNSMYVGDVNQEGIYFLKGGGSTFYNINLYPGFPDSTLDLTTHTLSQNISIHDWAFNAVDDQLYAVEKKTNILFRINPLDGQVIALGEVPILAGLDYTYGAVYFDNEGRFYVSANQTGTIYMIQSVQNINTVEDIESNFFAFGPSSASNDGARCPTAPVPQEICDNGIDDDGDGLIDCDDPSCSGFGVCDVFEAPTSGSNAGGLESNNRLSQQINARNFKRAKEGYTFNIENAKRVVKTPNYANTNNRNSGFTLQDFMPLDIINEEEVIEGSPSDLIGITNATEVYSVDYLKDEETVASVLALKTEDGVYEHTKYICDRLLGAELMAVSTISIKGQEFIKSIIKNEEGAHEFVLSFSAKVVNGESNFSIESHWNLDQYEDQTSFYNFQIWSNTIDDLYTLGDEVLNLLEVKKSISKYDTSKPPKVFVRKGTFNGGELNLQIINTNKTNSVLFDAGCRRTETSPLDTLNKTIRLNGDYISNLSIDTEQLFDIGFRIGDGVGIPDDLFLSDGPWGIDDSHIGTHVNNYKITPNENRFDDSEFVVSRNLELSATTSGYIAAYRALTPRYKAVDLSEYKTLKFEARGTGTLEVTILKKSIGDWNDQFRTYIDLSEDMTAFDLPISSFASSIADELDLDDVVSLVFTMFSETGEVISRSMMIEDIRFSNQITISYGLADIEEQEVIAYPNPMSNFTTVQFEAAQAGEIDLVLYDQLGKLVYQNTFTSISGVNVIELELQNFSTGMYIGKLESRNDFYHPLKLIIR